MSPPPADRRFREGRSTLDDLLIEAGCGALVVVGASSRDPDMAHFVGRVHLGDCLLVVPREGQARLGYLTAMEREEAAAAGLEILAPDELQLEGSGGPEQSDVERWSGIIRQALALSHVAPGRVAVAGNSRTGLMAEVWRTLEGEGWSAQAGNSLVRRVRKSKRDWELEEARRAARGATEAMWRVAELLAGTKISGGGWPGDGSLLFEGVPLDAGRLRREISLCLAEHGLHEPEGNIVAAGRDAGVPHNQGGSDRILRAGETLVVDLYPRELVFADCTRTFCVGEAPPVVADAHAVALESLRAAHEMARPGFRGWDLQEETCKRLEEAGYPTPLSDPGSDRGYVHNLGHGVGLELHEYPSFRQGAGSEGILEAGDLLTLEPGLYDPEAGWGVRIEDLVHLGEDENEILTPLPYELDPCAWRS